MNITRESIFLSSLRSFCSAFFAILGVAISIFLIVFAIVLFKAPSNANLTNSKPVIASDDKGHKDMLPLTSPVILKINIEGLIGDRKNTTDSIKTLLADSRQHFFKNNRVKGVLLYVDTPGGTVTDSNGIYEVLLEYKNRYNIPIYAFVDGTCASGGMYITSAADKVYASSISVIGSVGVIFGPAFNIVDLLNQYGVQVKTITRGKDKGLLYPFTNWKDTKDTSIENITSYLYEHFVDIVANARPNLNKDLLINEYGAQVYSSPEAEKLGFIEVGNSNYSQALKDLTKASGIEPDEKYQVVELRLHSSMLKELLNNKAFRFFSNLSKLFSFESMMTEKHSPFLYLYRQS